MTTRKEKGHYGRKYHRMRLEMIEAQPYCYLCGEWVPKDVHWMDPMAPQIHLIIPRAKGGSWRDPQNLRVTHRSCNRKQADHDDGTVSHGSPREEAGHWIVSEEP